MCLMQCILFTFRMHCNNANRTVYCQLIIIVILTVLNCQGYNSDITSHSQHWHVSVTALPTMHKSEH